MFSEREINENLKAPGKQNVVLCVISFVGVAKCMVDFFFLKPFTFNVNPGLVVNPE